MTQMMLASILHSGQASKWDGQWAGKLPGEYKVQMCRHEPRCFTAQRT